MSGLPQAGQLWLDRYEIKGELGRGGFGRVYRAFDLRLDRDVAIKVLRQNDDFTDVDHQRFRRETSIAASLEHPNIVPVYDGGDHEGLLYLVMRYVTGSDLRRELKAGPLPVGRLASIADQIGSALDYAHGRMLIHRDVKPANILCEGDTDQVYLADFGISRQVDQSTEEQLTRTDLGPGTFYYASPEQLQTGHRVDARTDVYAFGCVLYECLTGQRPFDGNVGAVLSAHLHQPPPRVSDVRADLSRDWDHVVATAMAKAPSDRYRHCGDLAGAVMRLVAADRRTATVSSTIAPTVAVRARTQTAPVIVGRATAAADTREHRTSEIVLDEPPAPSWSRPRRPQPPWRALVATAAALAFVGWLAWPQLSQLGGGDAAQPRVSARTAPDVGLAEAEQALLDTVGGFEPSDCRLPVPDSRSFAGQRVAIACADPQQAPTRVVYRQFSNADLRDAAFAEFSAGRREYADCRAGPGSSHAYRGTSGDGRVVCLLDDDVAGLSWTLAGGPILGSARLDDTQSIDGLYAWWDDTVGRDSRDRLPDCRQDPGLQQRGARAAVQCEHSGVASVVSHAQFASVAAMDAWYDQTLSSAEQERLEQVRADDDPATCAGVGSGDQRLTGADVTWSMDSADGRLLCFVNERDQNVLFWTNTSTAIGSVAVSQAAPEGAAAIGSFSTLAELVSEWGSADYRLAN